MQISHVFGHVLCPSLLMWCLPSQRHGIYSFFYDFNTLAYNHLAAMFLITTKNELPGISLCFSCKTSGIGKSRFLPRMLCINMRLLTYFRLLICLQSVMVNNPPLTGVIFSIGCFHILWNFHSDSRRDVSWILACTWILCCSDTLKVITMVL